MDMVCEHLNLLEKDYFGLTFADADTQKVSESCATLTYQEAAAHKYNSHRIISIGWLFQLCCGYCTRKKKLKKENELN